MPKYDPKSLSDAAEAILNATDDTMEHYHPAGGSQYGSWDASMSLPMHEQMSLFGLKYGDPYPGETKSETLDDFKPESYEVFLTANFYTAFGAVYESAIKAVKATAKQATYGAEGLYRMSDNIKAVEDANITAVFHALDKTQNRG
ncbi:hypothetical protein GCM10027176_18300 [Actinoallomurus bryophytorum]|uniref:Uncharacterized protein n=1 Tax=Actinoallomurus bryophytorum TaxID=1490222 RepID=A0A543CLA7_9ACTN|nr:hypothetical protein [Actinoallomurus bryophytorum]TQL97883.1 hypothetical protein FB559_3493 [Actinoallomurus bryophytorum]